MNRKVFVGALGLLLALTAPAPLFSQDDRGDDSDLDREFDRLFGTENGKAQDKDKDKTAATDKDKAREKDKDKDSGDKAKDGNSADPIDELFKDLEGDAPKGGPGLDFGQGEFQFNEDELRDFLSNLGIDGDKLEDAVVQARERMEKRQAEIQEQLGAQMDGVRQQVEEAQKGLRGFLDGLRQGLEEGLGQVREQVRDRIEQAREQMEQNAKQNEDRIRDRLREQGRTDEEIDQIIKQMQDARRQVEEALDAAGKNMDKAQIPVPGEEAQKDEAAPDDVDRLFDEMFGDEPAKKQDKKNKKGDGDF